MSEHGDTSIHRLFGWLQVSEVITVGNQIESVRAEFPWLAAHPHLNGHRRKPNNSIYIATRKLSIAGVATDVSGGGLFQSTDNRFRLTAPGTRTRSQWRLPHWFWPADGLPSLSYHRNERRWRRQGPWAFVKTVGRGQEFVFDTKGIPEANAWLRDLFRLTELRPMDNT